MCVGKTRTRAKNAGIHKNIVVAMLPDVARHCNPKFRLMVTHNRPMKMAVNDQINTQIAAKVPLTPENQRACLIKPNNVNYAFLQLLTIQRVSFN